jgi:hypothetical protein
MSLIADQSRSRDIVTRARRARKRRAYCWDGGQRFAQTTDSSVWKVYASLHVNKRRMIFLSDKR